jgi:hypothetical protein
MISLRRIKTYLPAGVLLNEIETIRDLLFHFREFNRNSQTIAQKVFLNEALKTEALFHFETALS